MNVSKIKTLIPAPESAFHIELSNDNSQVNCDYSGSPVSGAVYESSVISLWYGGSDAWSQFNVTVSASGITHGYNANAHSLNPSGITTDTATIIVTARHKTRADVVLTATYTLTKNKAGSPGATPISNSLVPSLHVVRKDNQGNLLDTVIGFLVHRVVGNVLTELTTWKQINDIGLDICINGFYPGTREDDVMTVATSAYWSSSTAAVIRLESDTDSTVCYDTEVIGVVTNGDDGKNAASGLFVPAVIWVEADEDGWSKGNQSFNVTPSVVVDGVSSGFEDPLTILSTPNSVTATYNSNLGIIVISIPDSTDPVEYEGEVKVRMEAIVSGVTYPVIKSIPIVAKKEGHQGEDGVTYEILPSVAHIRADKDGNILTGVIAVSAYKIKGESRTSCGVNQPRLIGDTSPYYWVQYRINGGSWTNCSTISIGSGVTAQLAYGVPASAVSTITSGIAFRLCYGTDSSSYSVVHEMAALQVVKDGQTGTRGKTGRYYYYDGYFNSSKEYTATDHQAPYVAFDWTDTVTVNGVQTQVVKTSYYMLIADTNKPGSTYIAPRTQAASGVWELMETSFKWLIAEAFFTSFAKLGSAVFCGDWMISQHGSVNGVASTQYELFDDEDPTGTVAGHFVPNFAIDLLEGQAYFGGNKVRFNADGSGWLANKNIEWDAKGNLRYAGLTYKKKTVITPDNLSEYMSVVGTDYDNNGNVVNVYMLDIMKAGNWIVLDGIQPGVYIKLPSFRFDGTYTDAEKDLARSLVGCSVIIDSVNHTYICGFRKTHIRFYECYDSSGSRFYLDDNSPNAGNIVFSNAESVYLECVLSDTKDSNGWYREDIMWKARLVKK